ncbi:MAG: hypothetical protein U1E45_21005 [Geminicoccaceae bacterium]
MRSDGIDSAVRSPRSSRGDGFSRRKLVAAFAALPVIGAVDLSPGLGKAAATPEVVIIGAGPLAEAAASSLAGIGLQAKLYTATGADTADATALHWLGAPLALPDGFSGATVSARRTAFRPPVSPGNTLLRVRPSGAGYLLQFRADDGATVFVRADLLALALSPAAMRIVQFDIPLPPALTKAVRATAAEI